MADPCFAIEVVVSQRIDAAVGPLHRDPLHIAPVEAVIAGEDLGPLQEEAAISHLAPHVEADLFPGINGKPDPLELHVRDLL